MKVEKVNRKMVLERCLASLTEFHLSVLLITPVNTWNHKKILKLLNRVMERIGAEVDKKELVERRNQENNGC